MKKMTNEIKIEKIAVDRSAKEILERYSGKMDNFVLPKEDRTDLRNLETFGLLATRIGKKGNEVVGYVLGHFIANRERLCALTGVRELDLVLDYRLKMRGVAFYVTAWGADLSQCYPGWEIKELMAGLKEVGASTIILQIAYTKDRNAFFYERFGFHRLDAEYRVPEYPYLWQILWKDTDGSRFMKKY